MSANSRGRSVVTRVWEGRQGLRDLHIDPDLKHVEIIMSVDLHMRLMAERRTFEQEGVLQYDPKLPAGCRLFGLVVRRDPTFSDDEIRFRSEVSV